MLEYLNNHSMPWLSKVTRNSLVKQFARGTLLCTLLSDAILIIWFINSRNGSLFSHFSHSCWSSSGRLFAKDFVLFDFFRLSLDDKNGRAPRYFLWDDIKHTNKIYAPTINTCKQKQFMQTKQLWLISDFKTSKCLLDRWYLVYHLSLGASSSSVFVISKANVLKTV